MSNLPTTQTLLAPFHREVVRPDMQGIAEASEQRMSDTLTQLWDALLATRERLETHQVVV